MRYCVLLMMSGFNYRVFGGLMWLIVMLLSSCHPASKLSNQTETEIRKLLPGTWHSVDKFGSDVVHSEKTFFENGTAKGYLLARVKSSGVSIYVPPIYFTSRWELEGHNIKIYDMRSIDSDYLDPAEVHRDRVNSITREHIEYRDFSGRKIVYLRGPLR